MDRMKTLKRPYPDPEFYRTNRETGFRLYPERRANYECYQAAKRGETVDYLPIMLDVENVSRCNFHCQMCQVSDWPKYQRAADMSFEDYTRLIDTQYGLVEIKLQGMGEPLMGKCYFDMIAYARARHIWVRSTTNASLLQLKDNAKRLIDSDICEVQVSIDGATAPTYEKIRRGGRFATTAANCVRLNRYAADVGRKRTRMWTLVQRDNFHELEQFPALAAELGFERLTLSLDMNDWGQEQWRAVNDQVDMQRSFTPEVAEALAADGARRNVEVTFWFIDDKYDVGDPSTLCGWPFERAYVSSDMRIVPCCMIANPEVYELGDARRFSEEWNGPAMRAFRRQHLTGDIPAVCVSCYKR